MEKVHVEHPGLGLGGRPRSCHDGQGYPSIEESAMSNGLYQRLECDCGAVCLLACGAPLGSAVNPAGETVTVWPHEAVQVGEGVDELDSRPGRSGGDVQSCRLCGEVMLVEHDEAGAVALPWAPDDENAAPVGAPLRAPLEALGYRFPSSDNG